MDVVDVASPTSMPVDLHFKTDTSVIKSELEAISFKSAQIHKSTSKCSHGPGKEKTDDFVLISLVSFDHLSF